MGHYMKVSKRQLRRIIREEKRKITEQQGRSLPQLLDDGRKGLAALTLNKILTSGPGGQEENEFRTYLIDIGYEDYHVDQVIALLADEYNL